MGTTMVSTGLADTTAQLAFEGRTIDDYDFKRTLRISAIGLGVTGPALIGWYGTLGFAATRLKLQGVMKQAAFKVVCDQAFFAPSIIPLFFTANLLTQGKTFDDVQSFLGDNFWNTLQANWVVWPLAQTINFSLVPISYQIPFVNVVSFIWNTYLAYVANARADTPAPALGSGGQI